jgi:hypothetical protein
MTRLAFNLANDPTATTAERVGERPLDVDHPAAALIARVGYVVVAFGSGVVATAINMSFPHFSWGAPTASPCGAAAPASITSV